MDISGGGWRSRIVGHGEASPGELTANPRNWRKHPKAQRDALAAVLDRVGWVQDVIVNKTTGHLVDGHARLDLARQRGEASVPVVYVELDADEEALILASLDPLAAMAETDDAALRALIDGVTLEDPLRAMLDAVVKPEPVDGLTDPDDVPEPVEDSYVQRGEVYILGRHRIMCGDSTDAADVARLLDGARPDAVVTDPPYGINLDTDYSKITGPANTEALRRGRKRVIANTYERVVGDSLPFDAAPLSRVFEDVVEQFWFGANYYRRTLPGTDLEGSWLVWDKRPSAWNDGGAGIDDVIGAGFELVWSKRKHQQRVIRIQWSGFTARNAAFERVHPTEKPVALLEELIGRWCASGGLVCDPFAGSGTTLIAAERQGRRCYAMEIEPRYVQVAITRWEQFTGRKAEKVQDAT